MWALTRHDGRLWQAWHTRRSSSGRGTFGTQLAQRSALRQAAPHSSASDSRARVAHVHRQHTAQHPPRSKHARPEHCTASTACAHKQNVQAFHMCTGCSRTRIDPTHAPAMRLLHARNDEQQHAQPALPRLGTSENTRILPACSRSTTWSFWKTSTPNSSTIATDVRRADASRSVPRCSPHPAAASAAPGQQSLARCSAAGLTRSAKLPLRPRKTCHAPQNLPRALLLPPLMMISEKG